MTDIMTRCEVCGGQLIHKSHVLMSHRMPWHAACEPTLCRCELPAPDGLGVCTNRGCKRKVL